MKKKYNLGGLIQDPQLLASISSLSNSANNVVSDQGKQNVALSTVSGIAQGAQMGAQFGGPVGAGIGAAIFGAKNLISSSRNNKRFEQMKEAQRLQEEKNFRNKSEAILDINSVHGNEGGGNIYRDGGEIRSLMTVFTDADSIEEIAGGIILHGKDHSEGGINIDTNGDGQFDVELENDEVLIGNRVYSNRLIPTDLALSILNETGIEIKNNYSYAEYIKDILKTLEKINDFEYLGIKGSINTNIILIERYKNLLEMLFADQETSKLITT